jgi:hypothetical protein
VHDLLSVYVLIWCSYWFVCSYGILKRVDYKFESASRGIVVQLGNFDDGPKSTPKFENLVVRAVEPSEVRSTDLNLLVRARVPQGVNPDWVSQ